ncbi:unnamed protein product [Clonostachys rosea]|uniref:Uncharacterized protein n=1 Tax=Bionectria ochroleuca TaxID=29856 RepID=A0ABY6U859_BIOOC|nr:unnamed protein product [Clonostachys rosea]
MRFPITTAIATILMPLAWCSQINLYLNGAYCRKGVFRAVWGRQCGDIPTDTIWITQYLTGDCKAYWYTEQACDGNWAELSGVGECTSIKGQNFKSVLVTC